MEKIIEQIKKQDSFIEFNDILKEFNKFLNMEINSEDELNDFINKNYPVIKEFFSLKKEYTSKCYNKWSVKDRDYDSLSLEEKIEVFSEYLVDLLNDLFDYIINDLKNFWIEWQKIADKILNKKKNINIDFEYFKNLDWNADNIFTSL